MSANRSAGRLLLNMRRARDLADALDTQDDRPPEYRYATVDRAVLRATIRYLREIAGVPQSKANQ